MITTRHELLSGDLAAITSARDHWLAALNAGRIDGVQAPLASDAMAFPPHEPALLDPTAMRAWHQGNFDRFTTRLTIRPSEIIGAGDLAFDRFEYTIALTPKTGGAVIEDRGNCVWLWRRERDEWRIARSLWNSTTPLPSP